MWINHFSQKSYWQIIAVPFPSSFCSDEIQLCRNEIQFCTGEIQLCRNEIQLYTGEIQFYTDEIQLGRNEIQFWTDEIQFWTDEIQFWWAKQFKQTSRTPMRSSFPNKTLWSTVSTAFLKSENIAIVVRLELRAVSASNYRPKSTLSFISKVFERGCM